MPVETEPEVDLLPLHAPEAEQLVALVDTQDKLLDDPVVIEFGDAARVTVGTGAGVTTGFGGKAGGVEVTDVLDAGFEVVIVLVVAVVDGETLECMTGVFRGVAVVAVVVVVVEY